MFWSAWALIFALDWRLALPAVLAFALAMAGPRWLSPRTSAAAYQCKRMHAQLSANVQENLEAHTLVKAFGLESRTRSQFSARNQALEQVTRRLGFLTQLMERSAGFSTQLLQVAVLGAGGYLAFHGQMSIGTLAAFLSLFTLLADSLGYIAEYLPGIVRATGGLMRVEELLAERPQVADAPKATSLPAFREAIEFKNVTFGYGPNQKSLDEFSLRIPRGASAALVGPSGSGKSTVLLLLLRFYDPVSGEILIDGHDLRSVTQESLRTNTSIVFQDNFLFSSTVRENILVARPEASGEEVEEAARQAEIHEFIGTLPDRYETVTGPGGVRLSGGQRPAAGDRPGPATPAGDSGARRGDLRARQRQRSADQRNHRPALQGADRGFGDSPPGRRYPVRLHLLYREGQSGGTGIPRRVAGAGRQIRRHVEETDRVSAGHRR